MTLLIAALIVAGAVWVGAHRIALAVSGSRDPAADARARALIATFGEAITAADRDPRVLVGWQRLAVAARALDPEAFALVDRAWGDPFPYSKDRIQDAHSRWTTEWLAWERTHDHEYKLKAAALEHELAAAGGS